MSILEKLLVKYSKTYLKFHRTSIFIESPPYLIDSELTENLKTKKGILLIFFIAVKYYCKIIAFLTNKAICLH